MSAERALPDILNDIQMDDDMEWMNEWSRIKEFNRNIIVHILI